MKKIGEYILRDMDFRNRAIKMGFSEEETESMVEDATNLVSQARLVQIVEKDDWEGDFVMLAQTTLTDEEINEGIFLDEDEADYIKGDMDYEEKLIAFAKHKNAVFERIYADEINV